MEQDQALKAILQAQAYFLSQSTGYKSWGKVTVMQVAVRVNEKSFLISAENKNLAALGKDDVQLISSPTHIFQQIFSARKKIQVILITQQQYAAQVQEEIPAILDDQAQLLGVSIRIAKSEQDILKVLSGRYAAILPAGKSICIGTSIEDAYVAAQLLEKTSKVFTEAKYLGGAKAINKIEAWFMQQYYQFKYSKEAVKNK